MPPSGKKDELQQIIVKRVKKVEGGHHGGAWKVAYADFVTAMMAFFLLLWLLNVSTDEQLAQIANYFDPTHPRIADTNSGAGGLMGGTSVSPEGAMVTNVQPLTQPRPTGASGQGEASEKDIQKGPETYEESALAQMEAELRQQEEARFSAAKEELEQRLKENPELAELAKNLMIDITPEGLRIQIVDQDGRPMFPSGKAEMYDYTRKLVATVADVVKTMPNEISIRGHTDANPYPAGARYTNWELSADRANASRRVLGNFGIEAQRLANVVGKADREHLIADAPSDPRNRRISFILLRESVEQAMDRGAFGEVSSETRRAVTERKAPMETYQKTPGNVYFP